MSGVAEAGSRTTPPARSESSWPVISSVVLSAVAIIADIAGALGGSAPFQFVAGIVAVTCGVLIYLFRRHINWIAVPRKSGIAIAALGVVITAVGVHNEVKSRNEARRSAMSETCAAARDYVEAWTAMTAEAGARGEIDVKARETQQKRDLERLSEAANRSGSEVAQREVQAIRQNGELAIETLAEPPQSVHRQQIAWSHLSTLDQLCSDAGYETMSAIDRPVKPSIGDACKYLALAVDGISSTPSTDLVTGEKSARYIQMFTFNAFNSDDLEFRSEAYNLATHWNEMVDSPPNGRAESPALEKAGDALLAVVLSGHARKSFGGYQAASCVAG